MEKKDFKVSGMTCAACSARVEKAVNSVNGVEACRVNLLLGTMSVIGGASTDQIIKAVRAAGYGAKEQSIGSMQYENDGGRAFSRALIIRLVSSALLLVALMYMSMAHNMWGAPLPSFLNEPLTNGIAQMLLCGAIMVINKQFFINGVKGIVHLAPNMDTLVAMGSASSFVYSVLWILKMSGEYSDMGASSVNEMLHGLYFESAAMILVLITVGKLLESIAKGKTTSAIRALMDLTPKSATVIREGEEISVSVSDISVGDTVIIKQGESIPCDGEIIFGEASVDESMLSGESIPHDVRVSDKLYGGTVLTSGYVKMRADAVGESTVIAEIVKTVKEAASSKAPIGKIADKISGVFVPFVMAVAVISVCIWLAVGADWGYSLARGISVLVISCPCALGLATPVAIMVGSGVGARCGILFKNAAALEAAGKLKTIAFDKTGTVTEGKAYVTDIIEASGELVALAAALENQSEHPIARAILEYYRSVSDGALAMCTAFSANYGGVSGKINGATVFGGNIEYISAHTCIDFTEEILEIEKSLSEMGKTVIFFACEAELLGGFAVADRIRTDAQSAIADLNKMGIKTVMITGDNERCAISISAACGISSYYSQASPLQKAQIIKELANDGFTAMVGDGINDAPALTEATVGIAVGKGMDIAIDSADVVLSRCDLPAVVDAVRLGRITLKNIYLNLFWAFCYNIIGIPLAAGAFVSLLGWELSPMFGAAAMSISSFLVVVSSLCINFFKKTEHKEMLNAASVVESINSINKITIDHTVKKEKSNMNKTYTINVEGMMCPHCSGRVKAALEAISGVESADVSHERADAIVTAKEDTDPMALVGAIIAAGYNASLVQ